VYLESWHFEAFKINFSHFLLVLLWVKRWFGLQHSKVFRLHLESVGVTELPNLLHLFPILDNSVDHWVKDTADCSFLLSLTAVENLLGSVIDDFVLLWDTVLIRFSKLRHILSWVAKLEVS
jgi:hypothetical protein